jgi:hypothetical protein
MPIEDRTPLAIVPHLMTDDHHSHGILLLLPVSLRRRRSSLVAAFILPADLARRKACESLQALAEDSALSTRPRLETCDYHSSGKRCSKQLSIMSKR